MKRKIHYPFASLVNRQNYNCFGCSPHNEITYFCFPEEIAKVKYHFPGADTSYE